MTNLSSTINSHRDETPFLNTNLTPVKSLFEPEAPLSVLDKHQKSITTSILCSSLSPAHKFQGTPTPPNEFLHRAINLSSGF